MKCNYIGSDSQIGDDLVLTKYGQPFELDDALANDVIRCIPFLPAHDFDALGHTKEHLEQYQYPGARVDAPSDFAAKFKAAHDKLAEIRTRVEAGGVIAPTKDPHVKR